MICDACVWLILGNCVVNNQSMILAITLQICLIHTWGNVTSKVIITFFVYRVHYIFEYNCTFHP